MTCCSVTRSWRVRPIPVLGPSRRRYSLSPDQARDFLSAAREDRFAALYVVAVHYGLRLVELLGLRREDLDLDAATLAVRRTLSETKIGHRFEPPKNGKGRRIKLTKGAVQALRRHRKEQLEERMRLAELWEDHGRVFPNQVGKTMDGKNLTSRSFKHLLDRSGLPRSVRVHDLRHTCATVLLKLGQHPKFVQELLGHANIAIPSTPTRTSCPAWTAGRRAR